MEHLLSVKTVFPRINEKLIARSTRAMDVVDYQFMGTDPQSSDNRWLLDAMQRRGGFCPSHAPSLSRAAPKIHHAPFDAHLIRIDTDYRIHVSDPLLEIHDGPFLQLRLK